MYSSSIGEVVNDSEGFCQVHAITNIDCAVAIQENARAHYRDSMPYRDDW